MSDSPEEVVRRFCAAWSTGNAEELLAFMPRDAVFHNVPMDPLVGEDTIRAAFEAYFGRASNFRFEILNMASAGGMVFAERVDHFDVGGAHVDLPCNGVFEVVDGRIAAWRDYFDMGMFNQQASVSEDEQP